MIQPESNLDVADNSGARRIQCIQGALHFCLPCSRQRGIIQAGRLQRALPKFTGTGLVRL